MIYEELVRLKETGNYELEIVPEPEPLEPAGDAVQIATTEEEQKNHTSKCIRPSN